MTFAISIGQIADMPCCGYSVERKDVIAGCKSCPS